MIDVQDRTAERIAELELQLKTMRLQLLQAQKMSSVGVLAASITHEFNNILTTVINYAKMGIRHKDAATRDKAFAKIGGDPTRFGSTVHVTFGINPDADPPKRGRK